MKLRTYFGASARTEKKQIQQEQKIGVALMSWRWPGELDCRGGGRRCGWLMAAGQLEWADGSPGGAQAQCRSEGQLYPSRTRKKKRQLPVVNSRPSILTCKLKTSVGLCEWVSVNNEQLSYRTHPWAVLSGRKHILALWHFIFLHFLFLLRPDLSDNKWSN